jgi:biopolymer transport protein ExbD
MARRARVDNSVTQDMTPMIDCVFLLIIFFMVATELSLQQAVVILPVADRAVIIEPQPGVKSITINVSIDNKNLTERVQINNGEFLDLEALKTALRAEVVACGQYEPNPSNPSQQDSLLEVIIRADQGAESRHFHDIFRACQEAKIYKVSIAAENERLENKYGEE